MHRSFDIDEPPDGRPHGGPLPAQHGRDASSAVPPLVITESFDVDPGTLLHGHHHPRLHLCRVTGGGFVERTPDGWEACTPGTIRVSPASTSHDLEFDSGTARGRIVELPDAVTAGLARPLARSVFMRPGADGVGARALERLDATDPFEIEAGALELAAAAVLPRRRGEAPSWLIALRAEMDGVPARGHSLRRIAERFARHRAHVARAFRERFGRTLGAHVRARLAFEAARRLRTTDQPIADLAHELGFTDQAHFTRAFQRRFGVPPGRFRKSASA